MILIKNPKQSMILKYKIMFIHPGIKANKSCWVLCVRQELLDIRAVYSVLTQFHHALPSEVVTSCSAQTGVISSRCIQSCGVRPRGDVWSVVLEAKSVHEGTSTWSSKHYQRQGEATCTCAIWAALEPSLDVWDFCLIGGRRPSTAGEAWNANS